MPSRGQQLGKLLNTSGDIVETSLPPKIETFSQSVSETGKIEATALGDDVSTIEQVSDIDALSATGNTVGDQRVVGNTLYIWNGVGWYRIALINETPTWDSGGQPNTTYELDSNQNPTVITLAATDPEGFPINYSYITSGQMDSMATISQDSSVFTITPIVQDSFNDGLEFTGSITFRASDGVNIIPSVSSFTLSFVSLSWSNVTQEAKIQASDPEADDEFGYSVSISSDGNTAIVGARYKDWLSYGDSGAAYIFTRSGTTWSQEAKIEASDRQTYDFFGYSVAISSDGNTAIVGAYGEDTSGTNAGSAYIFTRSGTTWSQEAKIQASDAQANDQFGYSVSISSDGNTAIVSALFEATGGTYAGAAYVFTRSGTTWSQEAKLMSSDIQANDYFGESVGISSDGNTAIVGAFTEDTNGSNAGSVYIFTRSGTTWSQQAKIQASDAEENDSLGKAVALSSDGNTAIVGAMGEDTTASNAGSAYIFTRSGTTWSQQAKIQASDAQANDNFGSTVSISSDGNTAIVGSRYGDTTTAANTGSAYIFTRSGSTWSQEAKIQASDAQASDLFGWSASISGDGNTAIVGAYKEDTTASGAGSAYIFVAG